MISVPCHCGEIFETDLEPELDLEKRPEIYRQILDGNFMSFSCPKCGRLIKTEVSIRLRDAAAGIDLQFLPELERTNYLAGNIGIGAPRLAIGYPELVEKITIYGGKLDERIIEIIKFQLLEKAENSDIRIFLDHLDNDVLSFHIHGLRPDKVGLSNIPFSVYDRMNENLDQLLKDDNISLFTNPPYISVNRIYLEE